MKMDKLHRWIEKIRTLTARMREDSISAYAASVSFFVLLSAAPVLMLLAGILPHTGLETDSLLTVLGDFLPHYIIGFLGNLLYEFSDSSFAVVSAVLVIWAAGKGVFALVNGLNAIHGVKEKRGFFALRLQASVYVIIFIVIALFTLVIMVYGNRLNNALIRYFSDYHVIYDYILRFRFIFVWMIYIVMFQTIYTVMPSKKVKFREQLPGAVLSGVGWSVFSYLFSVYIDTFNGFEKYGSLTTLIIAMFWLYFCISIFLTGALVNVMLKEKADIL